MRAWEEFLADKRDRADVLAFEASLEENIFSLQEDLASDRYVHGGYQSFFVSDPKRRHIHKASVRDRLVHHATHRVLYPYFNRRFIFDSYSSRSGKGPLAAFVRFRSFAWKLSRNRTRPVFVLKADIHKFFDSIDHDILLAILKRQLSADDALMTLLEKIIFSFQAPAGKGIPLGNLTSQLFSNVYLDGLDQFVKRTLKVTHYIRYADDVFALTAEKDALTDIQRHIGEYLHANLKLDLHPNKVSVGAWHQGIDVLGFISWPWKTGLRPATQRRMLGRLKRTLPLEERIMQEAALYARVKHERG